MKEKRQTRKPLTQNEIEEVFRQLGLRTEQERKRFQFDLPTVVTEVQAQSVIFIRIQATTLTEEERDA